MSSSQQERRKLSEAAWTSDQLAIPQSKLVDKLEWGGTEHARDTLCSHLRNTGNSQPCSYGSWVNLRTCSYTSCEALGRRRSSLFQYLQQIFRVNFYFRHGRPGHPPLERVLERVVIFEIFRNYYIYFLDFGFIDFFSDLIFSDFSTSKCLLISQSHPYTTWPYPQLGPTLGTRRFLRNCKPGSPRLTCVGGRPGY